MHTVTPTQTSSRHWWILGIRGLVAVLFGLVALRWPAFTLLVVVKFIGAYFFVDGVIGVIEAFQGRQHSHRWWMLLIEGLVGIVIGLITLFWPVVTAFALLYFVATWAIITGVLDVVAAFAGQFSMAQEWTLVLAGVISFLLGMFLFLQPASGFRVLMLWIGIYAIFYGILLIVRSFQFRRLLQSNPVGNI